MSFDPNKPVSLEEYNRTLRDSVNAYYEHAMQDTTMSKEEAIKSTVEMSEKYFDAVQEFQENQSDTNIVPTEDVHSFETKGIQENTNILDVTATEYASVDLGVSISGLGDDTVVGIDNDDNGVDSGIDL